MIMNFIFIWLCEKRNEWISFGDDKGDFDLTVFLPLLTNNILRVFIKEN